MTPQWIVWAGGILAVLGVLAALIKGIRALARTWRKVAEFLDDWRGTPERPGFPAVPGVPQRLAAVEKRIERMDTELQPNGGSSFRDEVRRAINPEGN